MSLTFVLAACAFAAVVGVLVACVDWWRESRLTVVRSVPPTRVAVGRVSTAPTAGKRAA
jgi:hypothetical protein